MTIYQNEVQMWKSISFTIPKALRITQDVFNVNYCLACKNKIQTKPNEQQLFQKCEDCRQNKALLRGGDVAAADRGDGDNP